MPYPAYRPPRGLGGGHAQTLFAYFCRREDGPPFERTRLETPDGDFLDLDWSRTGSSQLVVLLHGLEGHARRPYMRGMARAFNRRSWDAVGLNFRGCSGSPNRQPRTYHSGATEDLETVLDHVRALGRYEQVALVGFSLGGNLALKYLGERGEHVPPLVRRAAVFCVPTDLGAGADHLNRPLNRLYQKNFLRSLVAKSLQKHRRFPDAVPAPLDQPPRTLRAFDDWMTAPLHGFRDADDYYGTCSSGRYIPGIRVPTLIVNALDDPFLPPACYPFEETDGHPWVRLETPDSGGHVGFVTFSRGGEYWSEGRACAFVCEAEPVSPAAGAPISPPIQRMPGR